MSYLSITHPLNGLLCIGLGAGLGIYLIRRFKISGYLWWIGATTFVLAQVGHLPFNLLVLNPLIDKVSGALPASMRIPLIALLLGLSAGVFEEFTRYAVYRWWIKTARSWSQGLVFGAGHGGLEAILIGGVSLYSYIQLVSLKNVDLSTIVPANYLTLAEQQVSWYWSMPWYDSLLGGVERLFAIPLHLSAALLVLFAFTRRQFRWVWLAVGLHTLVDALAVTLSQTISIYAAELAIGILALLEIGLILCLRRHMPEPAVDLPITPAPTWSPVPIQEIPVTPETLEETRYQKV
jgi:uncharacterized membrane protein YhfC